MENKTAGIDYLRLLRRVAAHRWRTVIVVFLAIAVPVTAGAFLATEDTYEASAVLFLVPERSSDPVYLKEFLSPEATGLYQVILRSRSLAQGVIEGLPKESRDELSRQMGVRDYLLVAMNFVRRLRGQDVVVYSPTELAIRELQETRMSFGIAKDGTVKITATAFSPRVAVDLANTYVDVLLTRTSTFARQQARGTRELLENLMTQAKASQSEAEEGLRRFQAQSGGTVKIPDEARTDLQRLAQLEGQLADVQVSRDIVNSRLAYLRGTGSRGAVAVDAAAQPLRERLAKLEAKLVVLNEKYTEQHPVVQATKAEIQEAQDNLRSMLKSQQTPRPSGAGPLRPLEAAQLSKQMADLEVELVSLQTREQGLQQRIASLKKAMGAMSAREQEYAGLARSVETQAKLTTMLAEKLTASRISEQSQIRGIQVVDLAALPRQPSPKQPMKLLLVGIFGGLGLGVGLGILREYASQVVETEQDVVRATGLAVLGSIPIAPTSGTLAGVNGAPIVFVAQKDPHSLPADACRAIRTAIDCHGLDQPLKTLVVTSAGAGDGKTTVLLNMALAFGETGRRVVVIDADLRRPSLHKALEIPNEPGLSDVLTNAVPAEEAFRRVTPNIQVLASGIKPHNPGRLLSSGAMRTLLQQIGERADVILIDTPPVLAVSDCLPLSSAVDGVVIVARYGRTQRRTLLRAKELLEKVGARVVGVVVNGLSPSETRRYYAEYANYVASEHTTRKARRRRMKTLFKSIALGFLTLAAAATPAVAAEEFRIGTDDILHIIVWDNKDLEQVVMVRPDGKISYPLAGEVQAQGRTVPELTEELRQRLSSVVKNPNVSVMVKEIRSFRVHFVGKVARPGVYPIKAGTPLLQALTLAGGASEGADLPAAYVIRGEKRLPVDLRKLIQEGDLSKNIKLETEDTIVIPEISIGSNPQEMLDQRIYVLGKVARPGVYTIKNDVPLLHVLFLAGGVAEGGDTASAFVVRGGKKIPVDVWKLLQKGDVSQNLTIRHEDTIVIPSGGELQNAVYVMGEVNKPGVYSQPEALSLLKLVTLAGGFTKYASPGKATLIRRNGEKRDLLRVDLKEIMNDPKANEDISLRPGDVLIVPERLF